MKTTMTLQKQVLERIRTGNVRPTPKSFFRIRDFMIWIILGIFLAALAVGFGMILFMIKGADFGVFEKLGLSTAQKIIFTIPYFWIAATIAAAAVAYVNFRNTRKGYRISGRQFAFIAGLIAIGLGSVIYAFNITTYIDTTVAQSLPIYNAVVPLNTHTWFDPEHGLLSGVIREKNSDSSFTIRDSNQELWTVTGSNISKPDNFTFHTGDRVKIIGSKTGDDKFRAIEIRPW